jgi:uncharacterized protein YacL
VFSPDLCRNYDAWIDSRIVVDACATVDGCVNDICNTSFVVGFVFVLNDNKTQKISKIILQ